MIGNGTDDVKIVAAPTTEQMLMANTTPAPVWVSAPTINVKHPTYGAVGNGVADDTAALQAALTAARSGIKRGSTVVIPPGQYRLTSTLTTQDVQGIRVQGAGYGTILLWDGNSTDPALTVDSVFGGHFSGFQMIPKSGVSMGIGIRIIQSAGLTASRQNTFYKINVGGMAVGCQIGGATGIDQNNDIHHFEDCAFANYLTTGWSIEGSQAYGIRFSNCLATGASVASSAVRTNNYLSGGGSFLWTGGGATGHTVADFDLGDGTAQPSGIENAWFEGSARWIKTAGPSGAANGLTLTNNRWAGGGVAADAEFIQFKFPGPLIMRGNRCGDALAATQLKIRFEPTAGSAAYWMFVVEDSFVRFSDFAYPANAPTRSTPSAVY